MSMINRINNIWTSKQTFLATLYILGIIHWLAFLMLVYPEEGDKTFIKTILGDISSLFKYIGDISLLFKYSTFTANDWFHDLSYLNVMKEAIQTWTMPYHVPNLGLMYTIKERFLGGAVYITSPQILLLYFVSPMTYVIINHLIMYSVGFWGCLLLKKKYNLGVISFSFLYLMFNYNGYLVEKIAAYPPWDLGMYLVPFMILFILKVLEINPNDTRKNIYYGVCLGLVFTAIMLQGSITIYISVIAFMLLWGLVNYKFYKFTLSALTVTFTSSLCRLLPMALVYGAGQHRPTYGYSWPEDIVEALVVLHDSLGPPIFSWWEFSMYVSLIGFTFLFIFGFWSPLLRLEWLLFRKYLKIILPCSLILFTTFRSFKDYIFPPWLPFLNGEGNMYRWTFIPLVFIIVISTINLEGFYRFYRNQKRVIYTLIILLLILAGFLFNHSRVWRMHRVQTQFEVYNTQNADSRFREGTLKEYYEEHHNLMLHIQNNPDDILYIAFVWIGIVGSSMFILLYFSWIWFEYRRRMKYGHEP